MEEIKEHLHLDVMTVTGKTLGENLDELRANGFYEKCNHWLDEFNKRYKLHLTREDIIRPYDKAIGIDGSIAILRGNLAPEGAVIKHTACPKEMFKAVLRARPFDSEEECLDAVLKHKVQRVMQFLFAMRVRREAECQRCFIPQRQLAVTRSLERVLH